MTEMVSKQPGPFLKISFRPVHWPTTQPMVGIDWGLGALFVAPYVRIKMSHQGFG